MTACTTDLYTAKTTSSKSLREQALANALHAYSSVKAHLAIIRLTEEERGSLTDWMERVGTKLQELLASQESETQVKTARS